MNTHNHDIFHLTDLDRRKFLQSSFVVGTSFTLGNLVTTVPAHAANIKLPGFSAFSNSVKIFKNSKYYLVESTGLPSHSMMVGIKSWQQQIPTPQPYSGSNAWSIPIRPTISATPITSKGHFLRGAIAIAVNGVPIFNALNNRGEDALLAGELDDWGGHCGRADDYHYHIAPLHLQNVVGLKSPIAYALDGFPIYGEVEPDGKKVVGLDSLNGHFDSKKNYHYHGTKTFPYINGGFKGVVAEIEGQVDPQPLMKPFRPAGEPLRGASITGFERISDSEFDLKYLLNGGEYHVKYRATLNQVNIDFIDSAGSIRSEVYQRR